MVAMVPLPTKSPSSGNTRGNFRQKATTRQSYFSTINILILMMSHCIAFMSGSIIASNRAFHKSLFPPKCPEPTLPTVRSLQNGPNASLTMTGIAPSCPPPCPPSQNIVKPIETKQVSPDPSPLIPQTIKSFAIGMTHTNRADFDKLFDLGIPLDPATSPYERDILVMYSKDTAKPTKLQGTDQTKIDEVTAEEATENCDVMHVMYHYRGANKNLCLAIVPQYESYHIQNFMRVPENGPGASHHPLRLVSRGQQWNGERDFEAPRWDKQTGKTWKKLKSYLINLDGILAELKPIVARIKVQNVIIVMVCNYGQAELLLNFVCSAKKKGIKLQNVLLFATDEATKDIAESLGLTVFYDQKNFGDMPSEAAGGYGDDTFVTMMYAKAMCVHLVSMTGVDFLFQDVDVVWFKDPIAPFLDKTSSIYNYDIYFQDDGARNLRFTPWSPNSGFYFVRNNLRTTHFISQMVLAGDLVLKTYSHQQALVAILSEHNSLFGLKVKILNRAETEFPCGFHFHQPGRVNYFYDYFAGKKDPYIFHMSWTLSKMTKLLYLKQLGFWYVQEQCVEKKLNDIAHGGQTLSNLCCSAEPLFSCHYRDKPSLQPCPDSPTIDKNGKDFWNS